MSKFAQGNNRASKLTNEQVFEIRMKYRGGQYTQSRLSREYGVIPETIGRIIRGDSHQNVPMPEEVPDFEGMKTRIAALQDQLNAGTADRLVEDIQKALDEEIKPAREIERFLTAEAAKYGVKPRE